MQPPELYRLILLSFWLSIATHHVRIALNLKGVPFKERAQDLSRGAPYSHGIRTLNPAWASRHSRGIQSSRLRRVSQGATRCYGGVLSTADLGLASHLIAAARFNIGMEEFPRTAAVG